MKPYWFSDKHLNFPVLEHDTKADVVVIGAGITGASVSYWLSDRCKVVLLEGDAIASKASGRNAGFLLIGTSDHYNNAVRRYGHERAKAVWKITKQNHELLEKHIFAKYDCDHERCGSYLVAASEEEMQDTIGSVNMLRRDGFNCRLIERSEMNSILSSKVYAGAAYNANDGAINPVKLVEALVSMAGSSGTQIFERSAVKRIASQEGSFRIKTERATVNSSFVVMATNAYTPMLNDDLKGKIAPVRGQMLATNPQDRRFESVFYANHGYEYWRQTPDGRILAGGFRELDPEREKGYRMVTTRVIQRRLERLLADLSLRFNVECRWSGIMAFSKDHLPIIGPLPGGSNLLVSVGYSGHGLGFGFIAGRMISRMILEGEKRGYDLFSPSR